MWFHTLLCLAPIAGIAAVWIFQVPVSNVLLIALVLVCPLRHLQMTGHGSHAEHDVADDAAG